MTSAAKTVLFVLIALVAIALGFKIVVSLLAWTLKMAFLGLLVLIAMAFVAKLLKRA